MEAIKKGIELEEPISSKFDELEALSNTLTEKYRGSQECDETESIMYMLIHFKLKELL